MAGILSCQLGRMGKDFIRTDITVITCNLRVGQRYLCFLAHEVGELVVAVAEVVEVVVARLAVVQANRYAVDARVLGIIHLHGLPHFATSLRLVGSADGVAVQHE